jgi:predicted phosphate transport protein (TIGR00153 family)
VFNLMPKDEGFFDLFDRAAANTVEGARLLKALTEDYTDVAEKAKQIHNVEHAGDHLTREAIVLLDRTFIAPFDREEIHELVCRIDDVLDALDGAVHKMVLYRVKSPTTDCRALADVIHRAALVMNEAIPLLRDIKKPQAILAKCLELSQLESEGDRIEAHGIASLFEHEKDPMEVIKWKDIYGDLETATDRCQDVGNVISSIIIRHT